MSLRPTTIKSFNPVIEARRQLALKRLRAYHGQAIKYKTSVKEPKREREKEQEAVLDFGLPFLVDGTPTTGTVLREELCCGRCRGVLRPGELLCGLCSGLMASSSKDDFPSLEGAGAITDRQAATACPTRKPFEGLCEPAAPPSGKGDLSPASKKREEQRRAKRAAKLQEQLGARIAERKRGVRVTAKARPLVDEARRLGAERALQGEFGSVAGKPPEPKDQLEELGLLLAAGAHQDAKDGQDHARLIKRIYDPTTIADDTFYDALEQEGVEPLYGRYLRQGPRRGDGAYARSPELNAIGWLHKQFPSHQRHMSLLRTLNIKHSMVETDTWEPKVRAAAPKMMQRLELAMRLRKPGAELGISSFANQGLKRVYDEDVDTQGFGMRERMADIIEFKASRLRKNQDYEVKVRARELGGLKNQQWAPGAHNRALDDLLDTFEHAEPDRSDLVPSVIQEATVPMARAGNSRPASRGDTASRPQSREVTSSQGSRPNSRSQQRIQELRKAARGLSFANTLREGVDSQGKFY